MHAYCAVCDVSQDIETAEEHAEFMQAHDDCATFAAIVHHFEADDGHR